MPAPTALLEALGHEAPYHPDAVAVLRDPWWVRPEGAAPPAWAWVETGVVWDDLIRMAARPHYGMDPAHVVCAIEGLATAPMPSPAARAHQLRLVASLIATSDQVLRWAIRSPAIFEQTLGGPDLLEQPWAVIRPFLAFRDHEYLSPVTPDTLARYLRPQGQVTADPARLALVMAESWVRLDVCEALARDGAAAGWPAPLAAAMRQGLARRRHAMQCRWSAALVASCGAPVIGTTLAQVADDTLRVRPGSPETRALLEVWQALPSAWWAALPIEDHARLLQGPHAVLRELAIRGFRADPLPTDAPSAPGLPAMDASPPRPRRR